VLDQIIPVVLVSAIAFFSVYIITPFLIRALEKRNLVVKDYNRVGGAMIPRPGGPSIIIGILASEITLYAFFPAIEIVAILVTTSLAFIVGMIDDRKTLGGWFKPVALAVSAIPIILLGAYDSNLAFPLFGAVKIPVLYLVIIIFMIPITGNTINSIDVLNGVASGFITIASFTLTISLFVMQNYEIAIASPIAIGMIILNSRRKNAEAPALTALLISIICSVPLLCLPTHTAIAPASASDAIDAIIDRVESKPKPNKLIFD